MFIECTRLVQYLQIQHEYLVLAASPDMRDQVASIGHRVPHGLVWVVHADLEAHAVGQADRGASHHLLPDGQAFLDRPLSALGLDALAPLLHTCPQSEAEENLGPLCCCTNATTCPHSGAQEDLGTLPVLLYQQSHMPLPNTHIRRRLGAPGRVLPHAESEKKKTTRCQIWKTK